jgi:DNA-binding CsgD family transcriptional regulator
VVAGGTYVDPVLGADLRGNPGSTHITRREREVLRLLADGCPTEEIALQLFISTETVRTHIAKARRKLGARTRAEAVATAVRSGLIV